MLKENTFYRVTTSGIFSKRYDFDIVRLHINDVILITCCYKADKSILEHPFYYIDLIHNLKEHKYVIWREEYSLYLSEII